MSNSLDPTSSQQSEIRDWFDETYARRGLDYLRPVEAYEVYLTLLQAKPGEDLLDVACGPGQLLEVASRAGLQVAGIDLSPTAVAMCQKRLPAAEVMEANAEDLPFERNRFDYVTCIGSLERMLDRPRVLAEVQRVLRPGGRACFLLRNAQHPQWQLLRLFGLRNRKGHQDAAQGTEWTSMFAEAGFRALQVLPDQWPLMLRERLWKRLGGKPRFDQPRRGLRPMRFAFEYLFLLENETD